MPFSSIWPTNNENALEFSSPFPKHQAQIVRRHLDTFSKVEGVAARKIDNVHRVAHTPFRIARPQTCIERLVARRGVQAVLLVRTVEVQYPTIGQHPPRTSH